MTDPRTPAGSDPVHRYRGRFAPTPSGPLHLGSLLTALASWLCARVAGGDWLLRIDDLDTARCDPAWTARILRQLEAHGLHWDEAPRYQSQHTDDYAAALARLEDSHRLYACDCSRARLRASALRKGMEGPVYDGHCRDRHLPPAGHALRLRTDAGTQAFDDGWQGLQRCDPAEHIGDFIVRRRDGIVGYQLACAVDEQAQGITEVVRGADLLGSTFMQRQIGAALGYVSPRYRHLPVLVGSDGRKLSKQNHARAIDESAAGMRLHQCLRWLGQKPPDALATASVEEVLSWAVQHWRPGALPRGACINVEQAP